MNLYSKQYLGLEGAAESLSKASVVILPFPYEGGVSYGSGTALAPDAILDASEYLELYDEVLDREPFRVGITTVEPPDVGNSPEDMFQSIYTHTKKLLDDEKFVAVIGGDHSITSGCYKAVKDRHADVGVIQLDAHADLRDSYEGSRLSHASVMARIREMTQNTLQIGIRSMSIEEAELIKQEKISLCTMDRFRTGSFDLEDELKKLPEKVYITVDVDCFDWSVIRSTGTPEPGGFLWDEALGLLDTIFQKKSVVAFDIVELSLSPHDPNSPFAAAKLMYKMLGYKFKDVLKK